MVASLRKRRRQFVFWVFALLASVTSSGAITSAVAQTVDISTDQTTTQNLDTLAGGDPGTTAVVQPGVTVDTSPPGSGGNALFGNSRAWTITNDGMIEGQARGVDLGLGGSVTNGAGSSITGNSNEAIRILNGAGTVTNDGTILGNREAVLITGGGTVTNGVGASITSTTREAVQIQGGAGSLTNSGSIIGSSEAVYFFNGGFVSNAAGASITSTGREAIQIQGGVGTVVNAGTLTGNGDAILLSNGGSVTNRAGGAIAGRSDGIQINGTGTVTNEAGASITATNNLGVQILGGNGTVTNAGSIDSRQEGVLITGGGSVTNAAGASITSATREAVQIQGGVGTVDNAGTLTGAGDAVFLNNTGTVMNRAGATISGGADGIQINGGGSVSNETGATITATSNVGVRIQTGVGTVTNAGSIASGQEGVLLSGGGTVTNSAGATITSATREAVQIQGGSGTLDNAGTLIGSAEAVYFFNGGIVTNQAGASITSTAREAVQIQGALGTVTNAGTLTGAGDAVFLNNGGSVTNRSGATIAGGSDGIHINRGGTVVNEAGATITATNNLGVQIQNNPGTVTNDGTIDSRQEGVWLNAGGTVTNGATGRILSATREGVQVGGTTGTVDNSGEISGGGMGVFLDRGGSVTNRGTVTGGTVGTRIDNGGTLTNLTGGTITGTSSYGAEMQNGGTVENQSGAAISGATRGLYVSGSAGLVTNGGSITGGQYGGYLNNGGTLSNASGAIISGGTAEGIRIGSGVTNITNAGRISGGNGTAIRFGNSADTLALQTGSVLDGNVDGRGGSDALVLEGTGSEDSNFLNFESLTMRGTQWTLSGTSSFNSATIDSGILGISGVLNGPVAISAPGTLAGSGTIGGALTNDGTIAPGPGVATLTITGGYNHAAGAAYEADIEAGGGSDRLDIGGTATLNGGTVRVSGAPGAYTSGSLYTILDAGTVTGSFDELESDSIFLIPTLVHNPASVQVSVQALPFTAFAETPNQQAVAGFLDATVGTASGDYLSVIDEIDGLSASEYRAALDTISGDVYGSLTGLSAQSQSLFFTTITDRLDAYGDETRRPETGAFSEGPVRVASTDVAAAFGGGNGVSVTGDKGGYWIQGYHALGSVDGSDNAAGTDYVTSGAAGGVDFRISPEVLLGAAVGVSRLDADFDDRDGARGDVNNYSLAGYGRYERGPFNLDLAISNGFQQNHVTRPISFGSVDRAASADYNGYSLSTLAEAGYEFRPTERFSIRPLANLQYSWLMTESFTESGADSLNLRTDSLSTNSLRTGLGARLAYEHVLESGARVIPKVRALWTHELLDNDVTYNTSLSGANTGQEFPVAGVETSRDRAVLGAGVTYEMVDGPALSLGYNGTVSATEQVHGVQLGLSFKW